MTSVYLSSMSWRERLPLRGMSASPQSKLRTIMYFGTPRG